MLPVLIAALALQAPHPSITKKWSIKLESEIKSTVLNDRLIFFGTNAGYGAIDQATGKKAWAKSFGQPQLGAYVAVLGSTLFVEIGQGKLIACEAGSGKPLWSLSRSGYAGPIAAYDDHLFAELTQGTLSAIDLKTRKPAWSYALDAKAPKGLSKGISTKPILLNENILVGSRGGSVASIDRRTGKAAWRFEKSDASVQGFNLDTERVYAAYDDGAVVALSIATGKKMWTYYSRAGMFGNPLIHEGRLFIGSTSGSVIGVGALNGRELWKTPLTFQVNIGISQPIAYLDGILLVDRGNLVHMAQDGRVVWQVDAGTDFNGRAPRMLGDDLLLTSSHGFYRVSLK